jgi:tRNA-splicing ligase RtcB
MTTKCREGILRYGIPGLEEIQNTGIWKHINLKQVLKDIDKINNNGSMKTNDLWNFHDYVKGSGESGRDSEIATIGGGNHFIEIQYVEECIDKKTSYDWNLKKGHITIMVHTGSIGFGTSVGQYFIDLAKKIYPKILEKQEHGFYPLPTVGPLKENGLQYLSAMGLAANFAFVNRLMLSELVLQCLSKFVKKEIISTLVYDSPHNLIWSENNNISNLHRKGATPAEKFECNEIFPDGHPVIVPGSMGDFSYVLKGNGNCSSLCSASHGAGRKSARGEARKANNNDLDTIRVITKIDFKNVRKDVANEVIKNLLEEAPNNYKDIIPAIETLKNSDIAYPVAKLSPLLTIKG